MSQYALSLSLPPVFSADNFLVSGCNQEAWQWIERWPDWPAPLLLHGPAGSGKSHLGHIWAAKASARLADLTTSPEAGNWLLEDIERATDQRQLLHWLNYVREQGGNLLLTANAPAKQLPFTLPDLTSRLLALPQAGLDQPDDAVLTAAIAKQFADRQLKVETGVIAYLLPRMERSLAQAKLLVETLDAAALAEGRTVTIPFVKRTLEGV